MVGQQRLFEGLKQPDRSIKNVCDLYNIEWQGGKIPLALIWKTPFKKSARYLVVVVKPMPLEMHPSMSSGFSLWSVTAALLTMMMSLWCFANLQNSLLPVICRGTWVLKLCWCSVFFLKIYCKSTAGQKGQYPGYLVLLPKVMQLEKLREAISVSWKETVGM